ncbi:MAG: 16S rRNA (uracil(1498)-N(3))-methyltransferase, partial [Gammaproteobacteria bacterium]|nr:16S rRNA (uracil(1498)-N(3))-methyltransferase [Gammaproteobacteria bacterium]
MRHTRLHCETTLREDASLHLDRDAAHYLGNVLRMRQGQCVHVFNASDGEFVACIEQLAKKYAELRVGKLLRAPAAPGLEIELCLGLSRGDRMSTAIQKSTELGVSRITPFFSARGEAKLSRERSANRLEHWRRIAIGAVEQSGGFRVPDFSEPLPLERVLQAPAEADCTRLLFDPAGSARLPDSLP